MRLRFSRPAITRIKWTAHEKKKLQTLIFIYNSTRRILPFLKMEKCENLPWTFLFFFFFYHNKNSIAGRFESIFHPQESIQFFLLYFSGRESTRGWQGWINSKMQPSPERSTPSPWQDLARDQEIAMKLHENWCNAPLMRERVTTSWLVEADYRVFRHFSSSISFFLFFYRGNDIKSSEIFIRQLNSRIWNRHLIGRRHNESPDWISLIRVGNFFARRP